MEIARFTPDDQADVVAAVELSNAANKVDAPFEHPATVEQYSLLLHHGWDGEIPESYGAWESGHLVGLLEVHTGEWDNTHVVWIELVVHPDARGAGRGSELMRFAERRAAELGRRSIGLFGWDNAETHRFADRHRLPRKGSAIKRRQWLARLDRHVLEELYGEAASHAGGYELLRVAGRTPADMLDAVADLTGAINDSPTDDLDIEDEVFPVERIKAYESAQLARRQRLYRVVARHRESDALVGHTVVAVEADRPEIGDQHDTSVVATHRGYRLGLLLKADMLRWLADVEPRLATIDTWNMESNGPMIEINERLGYEVLGRELQFQRDVEVRDPQVSPPMSTS